MKKKILLLLLSMTVGVTASAPAEIPVLAENENAVESDQVGGVTEEPEDVSVVKASDIGGAVQDILAEVTNLVQDNWQQVQELQKRIKDLQTNLRSLTKEEQSILNGSARALANASAAVSAYLNALNGKADPNLQKSDTASSFRFINGQPVREVLEKVKNEMQAAQAYEEGEDITVVKAIADGKADPVTGESSVFSGNADAELVTNNTAKGNSILESNSSRHLGIDVSEWQKGDINWDTVKDSGIEYVILRIGYGEDAAAQDDSTFERNAAECERLGIPYGVYLYSYAGTDNPISKDKSDEENAAARKQALEDVDSEVDHVLRLLKGRKISLPVYLDMEENRQFILGADTVSQMAEIFLNRVAAAGYKPGIYSGSVWWNSVLLPIAQKTDYSRWVAQWPAITTKENPNQQAHLTLSELRAKVREMNNGDFWNTMSSTYQQWQFYDAVVVPGIVSNVTDVNYWYGPLSVAAVSAAEAKAITKGNPMYRMYNPKTGEHFYTASTSERDTLVTKEWKYEGIGWIAPTKSKTPVYRLFNPVKGGHHYTTNTTERERLIKAGWRDEGIGWYSDDKKGVPVYRQYNPHSKISLHNYTTSTTERDALVKAGWRDEGISWYGVK